MKKLIFTLITFTYIAIAYGQSTASIKYSPQQLKDDAEFLKKELLDAHANPFTELSKAQYEQLFAGIESKITDSLNTMQFYKLIKPVFSYLSDEHSGISIDPSAVDDTYSNQPIVLPINLTKTGSDYYISGLVNPVNGLAKGDKIVQINNVPVKELVERCSHYTTGFPDQRNGNALKQFGYLYTLSSTQPQQHYKVLTGKGKEIAIDGVNIKTWLAYSNTNIEQDCTQPVTYTRYGDAGYINSCTFTTHNDKEFNAMRAQIDSVFNLAKNDHVKYLFIDVSHNSGGNSSVGDVLINDFYSKPYRTYRCNWRRSNEYLKLSNSWGGNNDFYASKAPGSIIHFDADTISPPMTNPIRFNGKVYIIIGDATFSSAMMFATIVKDNHIAALIGQTPQNGHPNHFGELYSAELPNTKLKYRFGVKEWIRPAGKISDNYLRPDVEIGPVKYANMAEMIEAVKK